MAIVEDPMAIVEDPMAIKVPLQYNARSEVGLQVSPLDQSHVEKFHFPFIKEDCGWISRWSL